jgi:hypothetical protein
MPALVAGIHVFNHRHEPDAKIQDVDGRNKFGHDVWPLKGNPRWISATASAI